VLSHALLPLAFAFPVQETLPGFPERTLPPLQALDLRASDGAPSPIRPIGDFCLLDEHRLAILRWDQTLLVVTDQGLVQQEFKLPRFKLPLGPLAVRIERFDLIVRTGSDRVLIGPRNHWGDDLAGLLEIDLAAHSMNVPALVPRAEYGLALAASPEGGFALLARPDSNCAALYVFEQDGTLDWSRTKRVCAGRDVCFTPDGLATVLDAGVDALQTFHWRGWWSSYELLQWPGEWTNGLEVLQCAPDGRFWLSGYGSETTRMVCGRAGRSPLQTFALRHPDGTAVRGHLRLSPAGTPWVNDRSACLCRIDRAGEVDLVVGDAPERRRLDEPQWISIDRADHAFALAARDGALHEFDPDGNRLRVASRPAGSTAEPSWDEPPKGFEELHRLGFPWESDGSRWTARAGALQLTTPDGVQHDFPRSSMLGCGPASDSRGNVAFLRRPTEEHAGEITIVGPSGTVLARWSVPATNSICCDFDFDGERVVLVLLDQVLAWKRDGATWFHAPISEPARTRECGMMPSQLFRAHLARGGRELWLQRGSGNPVIERYALP
jgi:hypothetical protein